MNNLRPLHDRIVVRRLEDGEENVGGIIIPDSPQERPQPGTVIAVGNGIVRKGGRSRCQAWRCDQREHREMLWRFSSHASFRPRYFSLGSSQA